MSRRRIKIRIGRDGSIEAQTHGFSGVECFSQAEALERPLEGEATDSEFTSEFTELGGAHTARQEKGDWA